MRSRRLRSGVSAFSILSLAAACSSVGVSPVLPNRTAVGAPERFVARDAGGRERPIPQGTCASPLFDPATGAKIRLVRSSGGEGDYVVDGGGYGLADREVLRVECASGRLIGIARAVR